MHQTTPAAPRRLGPLLGLVATAALALGACSAGASALPSVNLPTEIPSLGGSGSPIATCVDAGTKAVLDQLTASGADIPAILQSNKDVLIAGLGTFQPADDATKTWRDDLVAAIQDGDMTKAETQIKALANGGVTLTAC